MQVASAAITTISHRVPNQKRWDSRHKIGRLIADDSMGKERKKKGEEGFARRVGRELKGRPLVLNRENGIDYSKQ